MDWSKIPLCVSLALCATPAAAMTNAQLNCPAQTASPQLSARVVDIMLKKGRNEQETAADTDAVFGAVEPIAKACAQRHGVPDSQLDAYLEYAVSAIAQKEIGRRLAEATFPLELIDAMVARHTDGTETEEEAVEKAFLVIGDVDQELSASGFDFNLMEKNLPLLGAYVAASMNMYRSYRELR